MIASVFKDTFAKIPTSDKPVEWLLEQIKACRWQSNIDALKGLPLKEYREEKKKLPCITFSGTFPQRHDTKCDVYSQLICLDVDHITPDIILSCKELFTTDPYVYACFISPSREGIKILVKVNCEMDRHQDAFDALRYYFWSCYGTKNVDGKLVRMRLDPSVRNLSRLCYVSYDPDILINPDSEYFTIPDVIKIVPDRDPEDVEQAALPVETANEEPATVQTPVPTVEAPQDRFKSVTAPSADDPYGRGNFENKGRESNDLNYIFKIALRWVDGKYDFKEGQRNVYIHCLACTLNRCGVPMPDAITMIDKNLITPDDKWHQSVRSAYLHNKKEFNSITVVELEGREADIPEPVNYSANEVVNDIIRGTLSMLRSGMPVEDVKELVTGYALRHVYEGNIVMDGQAIRDLLNDAWKIHKEELSSKKVDYKFADQVLIEVADSFDFTKGITTTFPELDKEMGGGLIPGNVYGLIGKGGSFKSIVSQWIGIENAKLDIPTMYLNGEMSQVQFMNRTINKETGKDLFIDKPSREEILALLPALQPFIKELTIVSDTGFTEEGILSALDDYYRVTGKKVRLLVIDGITQMDDLKNDEIRSAIANSEVCKKVAKSAYNKEGVAVIVLIHVSGNITRHLRNTADHVRGGEKIRANLDAYFCTSLLIDPITIDQDTDDIMYRPDKLYLRYVDKRGTGVTINKIVQVSKPMRLEMLYVDPHEFEIQLGRK